MFTLVLSRRACLLLSVFSCPTSAPSFLVLSCYLVGSCPVSSCLASSRLLWSCPLWSCPGGLWEPSGVLWGPLGSLFGASGGTSWLLGRPGALLVAPGQPLGTFWRLLSGSWSSLGGSKVALCRKARIRRQYSVFRGFLGLRELTWRLLRPSWVSLGGPWGPPGGSWAGLRGLGWLLAGPSGSRVVLGCPWPGPWALGASPPVRRPRTPRRAFCID